MDEYRDPVIGIDDFPMLYQVISIYKDRQRAGLVSSYGEYVGLYPLKDIVYVDDGPIFKKSDYRVGSSVIWIDNEDVYEGIIASLSDNSALMIDVKKLMPVDYSVRVPYWKIPDGRRK